MQAVQALAVTLDVALGKHTSYESTAADMRDLQWKPTRMAGDPSFGARMRNDRSARQSEPAAEALGPGLATNWSRSTWRTGAIVAFTEESIWGIGGVMRLNNHYSTLDLVVRVVVVALVVPVAATAAAFGGSSRCRPSHHRRREGRVPGRLLVLRASLELVLGLSLGLGPHCRWRLRTTAILGLNLSHHGVVRIGLLAAHGHVADGCTRCINDPSSNQTALYIGGHSHDPMHFIARNGCGLCTLHTR